MEHLNLDFSNMRLFHHHQDSTKKFNFVVAALKAAFCTCHTFNEPLLNSSPEEDFPASDVLEEDEVVVFTIKSLATEKLRGKPVLMKDGISWLCSPLVRELRTPNAQQQCNGEEEEEFVSIGSCFACCSTTASREDFLSAKSNFSRCSSVNWLEIEVLENQSLRRLSMMRDLCDCQGWPFGLCRKAVFCPPPPKSPTESWSWSKGCYNLYEFRNKRRQSGV